VEKGDIVEERAKGRKATRNRHPARDAIAITEFGSVLDRRFVPLDRQVLSVSEARCRSLKLAMS
jgi:hypothetical protein